MNKLVPGLVLLLLFLPASLKAQQPPAQPTPPPATAASAPPPATAPVKADDKFVSGYNELLALQTLIDEIEKEAGLPALRRKAQAKFSELQEWMTKRGVSAWNYDPATQAFRPPQPPPTPPPPPAR